MAVEAYRQERFRRTKPVGILAAILVILGLTILLAGSVWGWEVLLAALFCASLFLCLRTEREASGCIWGLVGVFSFLAMIALGIAAALGVIN